jgi:prepilin-type N-terminal cleavage/methylation domain-containing protein
VPDRDDAGVTLIELLVVMAVFGLVAVLSTQATIMIARSVSATRARAETTSQVRLALNSVERQIRSGNVLFNPAEEATTTAGCQAFGATGGSCMRVYTQLGGIRRCVQWQVIPDASASGLAMLRTRSFSPAWQSDSDVSAWRIAARGLQLPSAANPPFVREDLSTTYGSRLLNVTFVASDPQGSGHAVTLTSSMAGRNTTYGFDATLCSPGPL